LWTRLLSLTMSGGMVSFKLLQFCMSQAEGFISPQAAPATPCCLQSASSLMA
jgi:hypothetical protein